MDMILESLVTTDIVLAMKLTDIGGGVRPVPVTESNVRYYMSSLLGPF